MRKLISAIIKRIKKSIYFIVAGYFAFWAKLYLKRWKPTIITVTGSSGKTTLLHLFEAELGDSALYSHHANSAFGIPFHILGLERKSFKITEWFLFFIRAPFHSYRPAPKQKIYVTEADAERPGEGKFLAELLMPHYLIWLSLEEAHGINYDSLHTQKSEHTLENLKKIIAYEFGYFVENTRTYVLAHKDNHFIHYETERAIAEVRFVSHKNIFEFNVHKKDVEIKTSQGIFFIPALIPANAALSVLAVATVVKKLEMPVDYHFTEFKLPPGRSSVLRGIQHTTLIDSSYNATLDGMRAMLDLMKRYPAEGEKWLVLGDMIEQGKNEQIEHELIVSDILETKAEKIILVGPRLQKYSYPKLVEFYKKHSLHAHNLVSFIMPKDALEYLIQEINGNEVILFKGARFLEGIVEKMLAYDEDKKLLCRKELVWEKKRKEWGL